MADPPGCVGSDCGAWQFSERRPDKRQPGKRSQWRARSSRRLWQHPGASSLELWAATSWGASSTSTCSGLSLTSSLKDRLCCTESDGDPALNGEVCYAPG